MRGKQAKNNANISRKNAWASEAIIAGIIFILAIAVRFPLLFQSFWYDELYWLINFALEPWRATLTTFSPNNHVLYTLLGRFSALALGGQSEWAWRLPSALAGCGVAITLAWPLRKKYRLMAIVLALIASANPWLAAFSTEARGYALLLFLAVLATNWLPLRCRGIAWKYTAALVAAIYTIPLGILLVPAHAIAMVVLRRRCFASWLFSTMVAGLICGLLYAPFFSGIRQYSWNGGGPRRWFSANIANFMAETFSQLFTGASVPHAAAIAIAALTVVIVGTAMAWKIHRLRSLILTFGSLSLMSFLLPVFLASAAESRYIFWLIPLFTIALSGLVEGAPALKRRPLAVVLAAVFFLTIESLGWINLYGAPKQPVREALARCAELAGRQGNIIGIYNTAVESFVYNPLQLPPAYNLDQLKAAEAGVPIDLWAIEYRTDMVHSAVPDLEAELSKNFILRERLPGRLSDALIWQIKSRSP